MDFRIRKGLVCLSDVEFHAESNSENGIVVASCEIELWSFQSENFPVLGVLGRGRRAPGIFSKLGTPCLVYLLGRFMTSARA